jgi:hypothetical protein
LINLRYVALLCPGRERKVHVGALSDCDAARKMKVLWPFGVALRGEASNHLMLRWLKTVVVSDEEKAPVRRQVGTRKTITAEASKILRRHRNRGVQMVPG